MDDLSIDIIIPAYRLDEKVILSIVDLKRPEPFSISIYIVADNPSAIIPGSIVRLSEEGKINLLINQKNIGAAATRNNGIRAGKSKWILFLDDDIQPDKELLLAYAEAIKENINAIGFAGVTEFPPAFNAATRALEINGTTSAFTQSKLRNFLTWSPTANVMLNRTKMDEQLFDPSLINAEDIDFLTRNSLLFNEKYTAVPGAIVKHPWWNNGKVQTKRMLSYGSGASQITRKALIKNFTYVDFTNTSETLLLLILAGLFFIFNTKVITVLMLMLLVIIAEFITSCMKVMVRGKTFSPLIALHLMWIKNCYEFAFLYTSLKHAYISGFARRIDMSFNKPHPPPLRLNKWKIIKITLILVGVMLLVSV